MYPELQVFGLASFWQKRFKMVQTGAGLEKTASRMFS